MKLVFVHDNPLKCSCQRLILIQEVNTQDCYCLSGTTVLNNRDTTSLSERQVFIGQGCAFLSHPLRLKQSKAYHKRSTHHSGIPMGSFAGALSASPRTKCFFLVKQEDGCILSQSLSHILSSQPFNQAGLFPY